MSAPCEHCGAEAPSRARFCPRCGAPLGERELPVAVHETEKTREGQFLRLAAAIFRGKLSPRPSEDQIRGDAVNPVVTVARCWEFVQEGVFSSSLAIKVPVPYAGNKWTDARLGVYDGRFLDDALRLADAYRKMTRRKAEVVKFY